MNDRPRLLEPRPPSGHRLARVNPSLELAEALRRYPRRWAAATVAAALALSPEARSTSDEWITLLERLDDAIHDAVYA